MGGDQINIGFMYAWIYRHVTWRQNLSRWSLTHRDKKNSERTWSEQFLSHVLEYIGIWLTTGNSPNFLLDSNRAPPALHLPNLQIVRPGGMHEDKKNEIENVESTELHSFFKHFGFKSQNWSDQQGFRQFFHNETTTFVGIFKPLGMYLHLLYSQSVENMYWNRFLF